MRSILALVLCSVAAGSTLTRVANSTLTLPANAPAESGYAFENAFGTVTFSNPIDIDSPPGNSDVVFVTERGGSIQRVDLTTNTKSLFVNLAQWVGGQGWSLLTSSENGLLSCAFHPNFNQNGYLYVFYSVSISDQRHQRVARLTATGTPGNYNAATTCNPATHQALITQLDQAGNHNGGDMHFGNDGYLYISLGDEGGSNDQYDNARYIDRDFFSSVMRLDVDLSSDNLAPNAHSQSSTSHPSAVHPGTYKVPTDNPFVGATSHQGLAVNPNNVRTEFWVVGLRNPWRFCFDPPTGRCFIADVGQDAREEVNLVAGGEDCGWPYREGLIARPPTPTPPPPAEPAGFVPHDPIHDYTHASGDGFSITGGRLYRGSRFSELFGSYLFGDYGSGNLWALTSNSGTWSRSQLASPGGIIAFGTDPRNGDILICRFGISAVFRLVRATNTNPPPATLSATGAFSNLATLTPQPGIHAYDINHPFWSDHAVKRRWFSIPGLSSTISYSDGGLWNFPTGSVWIKHFDLETERDNPATLRPLETRFLVKTSTGVYGLTYRWRADGSDADLVGPSGLSENLTITENSAPVAQTWRFPARGECLSCHRSTHNFALSFHTPQLNCSGALGDDQIDALYCAGFLDSVPSPSKSLAAHASIDDTTQSREARVRAYLDVNCSMCHRQDTGSIPGNFDARHIVPTDLANLINGPLVNNLGDPSNRFLIPGDLDHSVVLSKLDGSAGRMPPLASNVIDQDAIDLITAWITSDLPSRQSFTQWAHAWFGETGTTDTLESGDYDHDGDSNELEFLTHTNPIDPSSTFPITLGATQISFPYPANRRLLLEQSPDLQIWLPFDHPDNCPTVPAASGVRTFPLPAGSPIFFRAKLWAP